MNKETLGHLDAINQSARSDDWKAALDLLVLVLHKELVFDNLAIYLAGSERGLPEVVFARAVGRGRKAEAEVSWGESIANQVILTGRIVIDTPSGKASDNRLALPYLLGLPIFMMKDSGAVLFVRFGGPAYTIAQVKTAMLGTSQISRILERWQFQDNISQLEQASFAAQLQNDFLATISHDLRTPLGFIKGYATSLLRTDTTWNAETQREFLSYIDEEADHLLVLVTKFLDSARLQSGMLSMDFQPVRLDSLIRDLVTRLRNRDKIIDVETDLERTSPIQADSTRLAQVFDNLFENAAKYAPDSPIMIALRDHGDHQTITFADHGPGISPEHLPFLFERFYRVPAQSGKAGTGLGLYICKQIVLAHNGQIKIDTAPNKGTAFIIDLPVKRGISD